MITLNIDPGAKRAGWAVLRCEGSQDEREIEYRASGILGLQQDSNKQTYQTYRLALIEYWLKEADELLRGYNPDFVVSEVVPPTGGNIASIINRQLALTVITVVQVLALQWDCRVCQLGATTVKKAIGGGGQASKVKVRDGVLGRLPELEYRRAEWTGKGAVADEVDAIAIGLTWLM